MELGFFSILQHYFANKVKLKFSRFLYFKFSLLSLSLKSRGFHHPNTGSYEDYYNMNADVDEIYDQLSPTELEEEEIHVESSVLEEVLKKGSHCLIGKLHTNHPYNRETFKSTMRKIWRAVKMIKFHELGMGMLLIEFEDKLDKDRVSRGGPWNFDKCLILLKEYDGSQ